HWSDPAYDALTNRALVTDDGGERAKLSAQVQRLATEQLPWIPLFEIPTGLWLGKKITGVDPSISYMYAPWAAKIGKAD
ncbi:hypothetical protein BMH30_14120, partial [Leucobacter sp. OLES1]